MNRAENRILKDVISYVAHHKKDLWWELKRQIFEYGYRDYYPRQSEFESIAKRALASLDVGRKELLASEWRKANGSVVDISAETIVLSYVSPITEEVVRRATVAAYRTTNW